MYSVNAFMFIYFFLILGKYLNDLNAFYIHKKNENLKHVK